MGTGPSYPQADVDGGRRPGTTTAEAERIRKLEHEVKELREGGVGFFTWELGPQRPK